MTTIDLFVGVVVCRSSGNNFFLRDCWLPKRELTFACFVLKALLANTTIKSRELVADMVFWW